MKYNYLCVISLWIIISFISFSYTDSATFHGFWLRHNRLLPCLKPASSSSHPKRYEIFSYITFQYLRWSSTRPAFIRDSLKQSSVCLKLLQIALAIHSTLLIHLSQVYVSTKEMWRHTERKGNELVQRIEGRKETWQRGTWKSWKKT